MRLQLLRTITQAVDLLSSARKLLTIPPIFVVVERQHFVNRSTWTIEDP